MRRSAPGRSARIRLATPVRFSQNDGLGRVGRRDATRRCSPTAAAVVGIPGGMNPDEIPDDLPNQQPDRQTDRVVTRAGVKAVVLGLVDVGAARADLSTRRRRRRGIALGGCRSRAGSGWCSDLGIAASEISQVAADTCTATVRCFALCFLPRGPRRPPGPPSRTARRSAPTGPDPRPWLSPSSRRCCPCWVRRPPATLVARRAPLVRARSGTRRNVWFVPTFGRGLP